MKKRLYWMIVLVCILLASCKTVEPIAVPEEVIEEDVKYHDIELICGNESVSVTGESITLVELVCDERTKEWLIVEMQFTPFSTTDFERFVKKNKGQDLSIIIPGRILLAGKIDAAISCDRIRIKSYSQDVAEELVSLMKKKL